MVQDDPSDSKESLQNNSHGFSLIARATAASELLSTHRRTHCGQEHVHISVASESI
jgi:hypothetical protein